MQTASLILCNNYTPVLNYTSFKPVTSFDFNLKHQVLLRGRPNGVACCIGNTKKCSIVTSAPSGIRRLDNGLYNRDNTCQKFTSTTMAATGGGGSSVSELDDNVRKILQAVLWVAEAVYVFWLFLLPYAPVSIGVPTFNFINQDVSTFVCDVIDTQQSCSGFLLKYIWFDASKLCFWL